MSRRLSSMVQKIFDKKISGGTGKNEIISNKELAVELRKPITRKFEKKSTFIFSFIDNILSADLTDLVNLIQIWMGYSFKR